MLVLKNPPACFSPAVSKPPPFQVGFQILACPQIIIFFRKEDSWLLEVINVGQEAEYSLGTDNLTSWLKYKKQN